MESFLIKGGVPLHGEVEISGSKNAALPIMAATLLTDEPCIIRGVPDLSDTRFMAQILESLGAQVKFANGTLTVRAKKIRGYADYELVRKMRGSICIAGPLLARLHKARISLPGGCIIGARPINLHLKGFEALGAKIKIEGGYVDATVKKLVGASMFLGGRAGPTVLGTANIIMAATLADGVTVIESAACEPEVVDLANFLNAMGADISGSPLALRAARDQQSPVALSERQLTRASGAAAIPKEILVQSNPDDGSVIELWLTEAKGQRVRILRPERGERTPEFAE